MKLYYSAGSCSTSCHITLEESGLPYEAIAIDWDKPEDLALVKKYNPLGTLPVLLADGDKVLAQNAAIHTYVAELAPDKKLLPPAGTLERAEAMHWLSFVAADLHKSFSPLFGLHNISPDKGVQETVRAWATEGVKEGLSYLESRLAGRDYVMGRDFTVVDAYAFIVVGWSQWLNISLEPYANIQAHQTRVRSRPAVRKVFEAEGLKI